MARPSTKGGRPEAMAIDRQQVASRPPACEIKGMISPSMLDWDGKLSAVLFLGGCNLRCPFCHNPSLVLEEETLPAMAWADVKAHLELRRSWLDAVCVTGGEPTLASGLTELLSAIKELGYLTKLDTNGTMPSVICELIDNQLVDYLAVDIKTSFGRYAQATGRPSLADRVGLTAKAAAAAEAQGKVEVEFRTTVVPTVVSKPDLLQIAAFLGAIGARRFVLQQFRSGALLSSEFESVPAHSVEELRALADKCGDYVKCVVRSAGALSQPPSDTTLARASLGEKAS